MHGNKKKVILEMYDFFFTECYSGQGILLPEDYNRTGNLPLSIRDNDIFCTRSMMYYRNNSASLLPTG
jgi:hypothetical protein